MRRRRTDMDPGTALSPRPRFWWVVSGFFCATTLGYAATEIKWRFVERLTLPTRLTEGQLAACRRDPRAEEQDFGHGAYLQSGFAAYYTPVRSGVYELRQGAGFCPVEAAYLLERYGCIPARAVPLFLAQALVQGLLVLVAWANSLGARMRSIWKIVLSVAVCWFLTMWAFASYGIALLIAELHIDST